MNDEFFVERCAGLVVHKASVTATVRVPAPGAGRSQRTATFATMVSGLMAFADWLDRWSADRPIGQVVGRAQAMRDAEKRVFGAVGGCASLDWAIRRLCRLATD